MKQRSIIFFAGAVLIFLTVLPGFSGSLDEYYLKKFGEQHNSALQKSSVPESPENFEPVRCGMPDKRALQRDWNGLEPSTQKVLAKQLALPLLSGVEQSVTSPGGHFTIHFTASGTDSPDIAGINRYSGLRLTSATDWANIVAATLEDVYATYHALGYQPAPTANGAPYDIYLRSLAPRYYGTTNSGHAAATPHNPYSYDSWMELDSSFTDARFKPATTSPLRSLQITAAHEYHHAIQYGYNYYFDIWFAESTSTWLEDELYDGVNQLYSYIPAWFSNSATPLDLAVGADAVQSGAGYSRWIFNRYLAETHGLPMIRTAWERIGSIASSGGNDIPMQPVLDSLLSVTYGTSLGNDVVNFAKRVYTRDWGANPHSAETALIPQYSPVVTYRSYPVNSNVTGAGSPSVTLPHYSFAYYTFIPAAGMTSLTITIDKTDRVRTALFKKINGLPVEVAAADANGTSYMVNDFTATDEVVLLIVNISSSDGEKVNFSTDGTHSSDTLLTVTPGNGIGFSLYPSSAQTISMNSALVFNFSPLAGYGIASVSGCGGYVSGNTYTTGLVTADCSIEVAAVARNARSGNAAQPTVYDALRALKGVAGILPLNDIEKIRYDVAPLDENHKPAGNGAVDSADVIMILRRSIGMDDW